MEKPSKKEGLRGLNVVFFESRHAKAMGDLIRLQGGTPLSAPALKEVPLENNPEAFAFAEKLFQGKIDVLVLLTGVGTRALVTVLETRYSREKIFEALRAIPIVPRGPKPIRVLNEFKIPFAAAVPEPNTWRELLAAIDDFVEARHGSPLHGKTVAVQEYGVSNAELLEGLKKRGAEVLRVPVYRWALPDDIKPLENAIQKIIAGEIQVVMFTTAVQIEHLFRVGAHRCAPLQQALTKIVVASIGPDCSEAIRAKGISVDIEAKINKMGNFVSETAELAKPILAQEL